MQIVLPQWVWIVLSILVPIAVWAARAWLLKRIETSAEAIVKRNLAEHQLTLDKELEAHRASLTHKTESLKSALHRAAADYSIYAEKRHAAIADLYASFLRAQEKALNRTTDDGRTPLDTEQQRRKWAERALDGRNDAHEAYYRNVLYLPWTVEAQAKEVIGAFDDVFVEHLPPTTAQDTLKAIRHLHQVMANLLSESRRELSQSSKIGRKDLARASTVDE